MVIMQKEMKIVLDNQRLYESITPQTKLLYSWQQEKNLTKSADWASKCSIEKNSQEKCIPDSDG